MNIEIVVTKEVLNQYNKLQVKRGGNPLTEKELEKVMLNQILDAKDHAAYDAWNTYEIVTGRA